MSDLSDFKRMVYEPETKALRQRIRMLRAALTAVQWSGYSVIGQEPCPACAHERTEGHAPDCIIAEALG